MIQQNNQIFLNKIIDPDENVALIYGIRFYVIFIPNDIFLQISLSANITINKDFKLFDELCE